MSVVGVPTALLRDAGEPSADDGTHRGADRSGSGQVGVWGAAHAGTALSVWLLLVAGASAATWLSGVSGLAAFGLLVIILPTLADLGGVLVALALGVRVFSLELGWGGAIFDRRGGRVFIVVRAWPIGLAWFGHARSRRCVRTRFWLAHLTSVVFLLATASVGFAVTGQPALGLAAVTILLAQLTSNLDASGRASSAYQLWTIPRRTSQEIADWSASRLARAADHALHSGDESRALALAERALDEDPEDRLALNTLAGASDRLGDLSTALVAAHRLLAASDPSSQLVEHANVAWLTARAKEAGLDPPDWRRRALEALELAEELGERWQTQHTRALVQVLSGWPDQAEQLLQWPDTQVLAPDSRAELLLTQAHIHRLRAEHDAARAAIDEARRLAPHMARVAQVERQMDR